MVVAEQVTWSSVIEAKWAEFLANNPPTGAKVVENRRRHLIAFHRTVWPTIQEKLQRQHKIILPDDLEPHWLEPFRAAYWHHSTNLHGQVTWSLTGPIAADADSLAYYLKKGWKTRQPEQTSESSGHPIGPPAQEMAVEATVEEEERPKRTIKHRRRTHRRGRGVPIGGKTT